MLCILTAFVQKSLNSAISMILVVDLKGDKAAPHHVRRDLIGNHQQHLGQLFPLVCKHLTEDMLADSSAANSPEPPVHTSSLQPYTRLGSTRKQGCISSLDFWHLG